MRPIALVLALTLAACRADNKDVFTADDSGGGEGSGEGGGVEGGGEEGGGQDTAPPDADGDGYAEGVDCDDADNAVNPAATERCDDGVDNDCDGVIDDDAAEAEAWCPDGDGDGYGDLAGRVTACQRPDGYLASCDDCDDGDDGVHPDALELCNGLDDDCDGATDLFAVDAETWYADDDGDGYGDPVVAVAACDLPTGYADNDADCDDGDGAISPDADEICDGADNDCDGATDDVDADGDGFVAAECGGEDCDDSDDGTSPLITEICDGIDNDCDGTVDVGVPDTHVFYADEDGDGYGDPDNAVEACDLPSGYTLDDSDCDDAHDLAYPGGAEACDGLDNDCDGDADNVDLDEDGYQDAGCYGDDCDDDDNLINPAASEVCDDGADNDCDGTDNGCLLTGEIDLLDRYDESSCGQIVKPAGDMNSDGYDDWLSVCGWSRGSTALIGSTRVHYGPPGSTGGAIIYYSSATAAGATWADVGDLDGDGVGDVLTGEDFYNGAALVYFDAPTGTMFSADADVVYAADSKYDAFGWAVAAADLDGDGIDDAALGAPEEDTSGANAGTTYLFYGPLTTPGDVDSDADALLVGEDNADQAGFALERGGDLDGDGVEELLVGAPYNGGAAANAGAVYVVTGPVSGVLNLGDVEGRLEGTSAGDLAGWHLDAGVDYDGDGATDLLVTAWGEDTNGTEAGAAYFVRGPVAGVVSLADADATIRGLGAGDLVGQAAGFAGDVDGDGLQDLIVGGAEDDTAASNAGSAWLLYGIVSGEVDLSTADAQIVGNTSGKLLGSSVAGVGDIDADGYDDVAIGAGEPYDDNGSYLFLGSAGW